jgi:hypothetical protein
MGGSAAQNMMQTDASNYVHLTIPTSRAHLPLFGTLIVSMLPLPRFARYRKPSMSKIDFAVATKLVTYDTKKVAILGAKTWISII